jgi:hypothetical protein
MFNPFSTPKTRDEWRARTRAIQERLEGLSIAELMRGITKGVSSGRAGHEYDPNQPRVPAGHPDGGQWTNKAKLGGERINDPRVISDETPDNHWIVGADYAAGHHYDPRQLWKNLPLQPETRQMLDRAVSGPLEFQAYNPITRKVSRHRWDREHQEYNQAVGELFQMFLDGLRNLGITVERMTPAHAREFIAAIHRSQDPRIYKYNAMIRFLRSMRMLRGSE